MAFQFALCNLHFVMLYSTRAATAPDKVFTLRFACPSENRGRQLREYKTLDAIGRVKNMDKETKKYWGKIIIVICLFIAELYLVQYS